MGYRVVVLEKSRGVGGRAATRRLHDTCVDHGLPALTVQGEQTDRLIKSLVEQRFLQPWADTVYELGAAQTPTSTTSVQHYVASQGITAIAKALAAQLEVRQQCRVTKLHYHSSPDAHHWLLTLDTAPANELVAARGIVIAIPAPQALDLIEPLALLLPSAFLAQLRSVVYHPCISAIASYPTQYQSAVSSLPWQFLRLQDPKLSSIVLDSSKRRSQQPLWVLHSTPQFAQLHLDNNDLQPAGQELLARAAERLLPWLDQPEWLQVHRWRYAFPAHFLPTSYLDAELLPMICCGDWCGGNLVESALTSGTAAAEALVQRL